MELLKEVMYLLLAIFLIIVVIAGCTNLYGSFTKSAARQQAAGTLENLANFLTDLRAGTADEFLVYAPQGYYLVSFDNKENRLDECIQKNCICICEKKDCSTDRVCKETSMPAKMNGNDISIKIDILDISIANNGIQYLFSTTPQQGTLSEGAKTTRVNIAVDTSYLLDSRERDTSLIDTIVLHHTAGTDFKGAYDALVQRGLSVQYMIDRDGKIYSLVDESREAFHAGSEENYRSIGIELVSTGCINSGYTDAQYSSLNALIKDIISRWHNITLDDQHIIGHYETPQGKRVGKNDPANFDWAKIGLPNHIPSAAAC